MNSQFFNSIVEWLEIISLLFLNVVHDKGVKTFSYRTNPNIVDTVASIHIWIVAKNGNNSGCTE